MKNILRRIPRLLLVSCILLTVLVVGALAYLSASTGSLTNTFKPATETNPSILEGPDGNTFDGITKEQVKVNVGDPGYAVYVRAAIVVNWEEDGKDGTYHATAPVAGTDYTLTLNTTDWFQCKYDDETDFYFYYHEKPVAYDGTNENSKYTKVLINSCQVKDGAAVPDGYHLDVQIIAQTIQALGTTDAVDANGDPTPAVEDAWKVVTVDNNGSLIPITP